jgi:hypothetical protein
MDPIRRAALARRRRERNAGAVDAKAADLAADAAARLRSIFYEKQRAFFRSPHKRKATKKTRRAGATTGGCSELLARAITLEGHRAEQGFRASIGHNTRVEAKARAWRNDTKSGIVDVLEQHGQKVIGASIETYRLGGVTVEVREAELALDFGNGSRIDLFGCDSDSDLGKLRSNAKHVVWIDEAQDPRWVALLSSLYKGTITGMADYQVETWITGTPGKDPAGMFFEITRDDAPGLPGWEIHVLSVVDNPFFGATPEERWAATAEKALVENGWTIEDPDFQREWMAKWVMSDARFVYAANAVPIHDLIYAPERFLADGFPDLLAAMADLPGYRDGRDYFLGMGNDLGVYAFSVRAWSLHDSCLYEVASFKQRGWDYDEMFACIKRVRETLSIGLLVGDAGGGGKQAVMGWSKKLVERYEVPMIEAKKTNKHTAQDQYNNDMRKGYQKYRGTPEKPSPLLKELLTHRWAPIKGSDGKLVESKDTDNHCCDADLYIHRESHHHRFREPPPPPPEKGSREALQQEERELEEEQDYDGN